MMIAQFPRAEPSIAARRRKTIIPDAQHVTSVLLLSVTGYSVLILSSSMTSLMSILHFTVPVRYANSVPTDYLDSFFRFDAATSTYATVQFFGKPLPSCEKRMALAMPTSKSMKWNRSIWCDWRVSTVLLEYRRRNGRVSSSEPITVMNTAESVVSFSFSWVSTETSKMISVTNRRRDNCSSRVQSLLFYHRLPNDRNQKHDETTDWFSLNRCARLRPLASDPLMGSEPIRSREREGEFLLVHVFCSMRHADRCAWCPTHRSPECLKKPERATRRSRTSWTTHESGASVFARTGSTGPMILRSAWTTEISRYLREELSSCTDQHLLEWEQLLHRCHCKRSKRHLISKRIHRFVSPGHKLYEGIEPRQSPVPCIELRQNFWVKYFCFSNSDIKPVIVQSLQNLIYMDMKVSSSSEIGRRWLHSLTLLSCSQTWLDQG